MLKLHNSWRSSRQSNSSLLGNHAYSAFSIDLAEFQFVGEPILELELIGSVEVCIELIPPPTILEKDISVLITTVNGTALGQ